MKRNLAEVLDALLEVAPDLVDLLKATRESLNFAAPEMVPMFWHEAQEVLGQVPEDHPKRRELVSIWTGQTGPGSAAPPAHVFIYMYTNGTFKTSRGESPRIGPAHGAQTTLQVRPDGAVVVRKDVRHNGYPSGAVLTEVRFRPVTP